MTVFDHIVMWTANYSIYNIYFENIDSSVDAF
jgi:hypothetical protein